MPEFFGVYLGLKEAITFLLLKAFLKGTLSRGKIELPLTRKCDQFTKAVRKKEGETLRCPNSIDDGQMDMLVTYTKHSKFSIQFGNSFSKTDRFYISLFLTIRGIHVAQNHFTIRILSIEIPADKDKTRKKNPYKNKIPVENPFKIEYPCQQKSEIPARKIAFNKNPCDKKNPCKKSLQTNSLRIFTLLNKNRWRQKFLQKKCTFVSFDTFSVLLFLFLLTLSVVGNVMMLLACYIKSHEISDPAQVQ